MSRKLPLREPLEPLELALPLEEVPLKWPRDLEERSRPDFEDDGLSLSRREDDDLRSFLKEDRKEDFDGFLEDDADTTAEVNLGIDFAISMWAD